jgi:hypothetical protein
MRVTAFTCALEVGDRSPVGTGESVAHGLHGDGLAGQLPRAEPPMQSPEVDHAPCIRTPRQWMRVRRPPGRIVIRTTGPRPLQGPSEAIFSKRARNTESTAVRDCIFELIF